MQDFMKMFIEEFTLGLINGLPQVWFYLILFQLGMMKLAAMLGKKIASRLSK
jgi:hypothetical protein